MGINVSSWKLAKAVSSLGRLGVVLGTAIDTVVARTLQLGDPDGNLRRALESFPFPEMAQRIAQRYIIAGGKNEGKPFKSIGMASLPLTAHKVELLVFANFATVFLAKEGHQGMVGINYLEKIQTPTLPSLYGAMLAGVDVVLMGAGIPVAIPGILDNLADGNPVSLRIHVEDNPSGKEFHMHFDPRELTGGASVPLTRPLFFGIVSADIVARQMERRASGTVDGYIIENHTAGGHNAPPRRHRSESDDQASAFGEKDEADLEKVRQLGKPFWLAGQFSTPEKFRSALSF